jgi:predicted DNA-binding protein
LPQFTITLSQKAVDRLSAQVQRTNDANGTDLAVRDWIELHLNEIAIADDLTTAVKAIQEQQQRDAQDALQAAIRAQRDHLLEGLGEPDA